MSELSDQEIERIRIHLRHALQEDLSGWIRARFWIAAIVIGALSFFGVRGIVQQVFEEDLKDARKATQEIVVKAETAIALASDATAKAKAAAEAVESDVAEIRRGARATQTQLDAYGKTLGEIEERAKQVRASFEVIEIRIAEVRAGATTLTQGSVDALLGRMQILEETVAAIADDVDYVTATGASVSATQAEVARESERKLGDVQVRSEFSVWLWVAHLPLDKQEAIIHDVKALGLPVTTPAAEIPLYPFADLGMEALVEALAPGCVVVATQSPDDPSAVRLASELRDAFAASNPCAELVYSPGMSSGGAIVTTKPEA